MASFIDRSWERLPGWAKWMLGIIGAIVLVAIGAAAGGGESEKGEIEHLQRRIAAVSKERDEAEEATGEAEKAAGDAEDKASRIEGLRGKIVDKAKAQAASIEDKADSLQGELSSKEAQLEDVEESLNGAREEKRLSTIPGNGTFQSEVDYMPGTYRSNGGGTCYWATLNSADPFDIASNENATGPTIASIDTPYFQTKGCGRWERIGE
jgi:hypothetical protein